jgi:outer membrane protein assembly factor BamB
VTLQWALWIIVPLFAPQATPISIIGGVVLGLVVLLWWLFFSRAPWIERFGAIPLMIAGVLATSRVVHESIANGMMGLMLPIYAVPALSLALVAWAVSTRGLSDAPRRASMILSIVIACGAFTVLRTGGITGDADADLHWRWTQTPEQRLLVAARDEPMPPQPPKPVPVPSEPPAVIGTGAPAPAPTPSSFVMVAAEWPGFRGPQRDSIIHGVRIETDWSQSPPTELWRRSIGPGWSSFAVAGDVFFTQEQRGDDEIVSAYSVTTGEPVWRHRDPARFWESNAGAGPRGTPTLASDRVYTFGATGILNALDARTGSVIWSRNAAADTGSQIPDWGFASSPLVIDDMVVVATAGVLAAYDRERGNPRWVGPKDAWGYSSPQLSTIDGVTQIVLLDGAGAIGVAPADGRVLWRHSWPGDGIVQPAVVNGRDVLIGSGSGLAAAVGMRRVAVVHGSGGWTATERWTSNALKPYFNDFVVHEGHAFGFDGSILACLDLQDGARKWKGGRYGHGQLLLLPEQDLLLVVSEDGELALVSATPDGFKELARAPAIEGKTWNHPVLVRDALLVRNGQEMAAFRLPLARSKP